MNYTKLSSQATKKLFTAVKEGSKLQILNITYNAITDDVANNIATALLSQNVSLFRLNMCGNNISDKTMLPTL